MTNDESIERVSQWRALARNLKAGLRAVVFLRVSLQEGDANWTQLMSLVILSLLIQFGWDFSRVGLNGEFNEFALPGAAFAFPTLLFVAYLAASQVKRPEKTMPLAVVFCAVVIPFNVLTPMLHWLPRRLDALLSMGWGYGGYPLIDFWIALSCGVAAVRLLAIAGWPGRMRVWLLAVSIAALAFTTTFHGHALWSLPYNPEAAQERLSEYHALDQEAVFYQQPKLLQQELDSVVPQRHEGINLYFVGVAGYADQDVFLKEIRYVDKLFQDRFGTAGHSILLVNNPKTAKQLPIASATSIGLALKKVGDSMDKDRDILFLYLTSHGSHDHVFTLDFGDMKFDDLNPPRLRKLLDESGIKHRVVVVGACYSGGFVDALKNDDTLVITSAAPDRTSFGCSDEEDFTYFGRAYFADALSGTDSFIDAFSLAKPIVAAREREEDFTPSDPRIDVGAAIRGPLEAFARQQRAARVAQDLAKYKLRPDIAAAPPSVNAEPAVNVPVSPHTSQMPEDERLAAARELVGLTRYKTQLQDSIDECEKYIVERGSLEKEFEKDPSPFQGLTPQSVNWPKLVKAYHHYWEQNCNLFHEDVYVDVMTRSYATGMTKQELADAVKFLSTPAGQAFVTSALSASKSFQAENAKQVRVRHQKVTDEYNAALAELVAAEPKARLVNGNDPMPWWHFW